MTTAECQECKGKCCRDQDYGCRVYHMAAECYEHWCDACHDGTVPQPDPRDEEIALIREVWVAEQKAAADTILRLELENRRLRDELEHARYRYGAARDFCEDVLEHDPRDPHSAYSAGERQLAKAILARLEVKP